MTEITALDSGSAMVKKKRRLPQPSICAASHRSGGRLVSKKVRATMMLYALTEKGSTSTQKVLYSPACCTVRKMGIRPPEKNMVNTYSPIRPLRPHRSLRERA